MKIVVLNGSPKGHKSVTMQYVLYIQKKFPEASFEIINISQKITLLEREKKEFSAVIQAVKSADTVIWATPVYFLVVPSQYMRFIELIHERKAAPAFSNKHAAILVTSIHFFDHTSKNYLTGICDDLNMKLFGALSPDMYDLMKSSNRRTIETFARHFIEAIKKQEPAARHLAPLTARSIQYKNRAKKATIDPGDKKIVIVTDCDNSDSNISRMIQRFSDNFTRKPTILNIGEMGIRAGCTGCCRCGLDNICIHKDTFAENFDAYVKPADILIFAGTVRQRFFSSTWKLFIDRSFYNGHVPSLPGKQFGLLVSGPLGQLPNIQEVFEAIVEMQVSNLAGLVSDEYDSPQKIDSLIDAFARRIVNFANDNYIQPQSFLGVGGKKVFRDDIWGRLRFVFQKDHEYYKTHGGYDFPQKDYKMRLRASIMMMLTKIPYMRKEIEKRIVTEMVKPLEYVVKNK